MIRFITDQDRWNRPDWLEYAHYGHWQGKPPGEQSAGRGRLLLAVLSNKMDIDRLGRNPGMGLGRIRLDLPPQTAH
jgi:hypothetical protein